MACPSWRTQPGHWLTNDEIAKESGVKVRTARQYTLRLVKQGLLERADTFPAYRFRLVSKAEPSAYQQRIEAVIEAFGLQADAPGGHDSTRRLDLV